MSPLNNALSQLLSADINQITLSEKQWEAIVLIAREAGVLARLFYVLSKKGQFTSSSEYAQKHMNAARLYAERQAQQVRYECLMLTKVVAQPAKGKFAFLKGAAYVLSENDVALGRTFSDIDLVVSKEDIREVEKKLNVYAWFADETSDYDQQYYRTWTHEIPPLRHAVRRTVLDLHHNIVPPISGRAPDMEILWETVTKRGDFGYTFSAAGMALHSLIHLFFQEDFSNSYRDLSDLNMMFSQHSADPVFWQDLVQLASDTDFARELYFACRYTTKIFNTSVPESVFQKLNEAKPSALKLPILDWIFERVLLPHHSLSRERYLSLATFMALVRGHWLKMPLHILLYHTGAKLIHGINFLVTGRDRLKSPQNKSQEG